MQFSFYSRGIRASWESLVAGTAVAHPFLSHPLLHHQSPLHLRGQSFLADSSPDNK